MCFKIRLMFFGKNVSHKIQGTLNKGIAWGQAATWRCRTLGGVIENQIDTNVTDRFKILFININDRI